MTMILRAKPIVEKRTSELATICHGLIAKNKQPKLVVILVGNNPASLSYIKNKEKLCTKVGIEFELIHLDESTPKNDFLKLIDRLNNDKNITGFFVQLPVSNHLKDINIPYLINPKKDVDGFHFESVLNLYQNNLDGLIPCTPKGIIALLNFYDIDVSGKNITIIGRSHIVGKPLSLLLTAKNATVTLCHSKTKNLITHTQSADIIISAVGKPNYLTPSYLNPSGNQYIIDVGISNGENGITGDVDFDSVLPLVKGITPVPGGVGPMTVLSLMENIILAENLKEQK